MTYEEVIEYLLDPIGKRDKHDEAIATAIAAIKKLEAIQACTPPTDDWEHYADRLHDIAYKYGYEQGKRDATT